MGQHIERKLNDIYQILGDLLFDKASGFDSVKGFDGEGEPIDAAIAQARCDLNYWQRLREQGPVQ